MKQLVVECLDAYITPEIPKPLSKFSRNYIASQQIQLLFI